MKDDRIVQLYLDRDESEISQTQEKYGSRVHAVSYRITSDSGIAEECENDTYLKVWNRIPPSGLKNYFYAFLVRII